MWKYDSEMLQYFAQGPWSVYLDQILVLIPLYLFAPGRDRYLQISEE